MSKASPAEVSGVVWPLQPLTKQTECLCEQRRCKLQLSWWPCFTHVAARFLLGFFSVCGVAVVVPDGVCCANHWQGKRSEASLSYIKYWHFASLMNVCLFHRVRMWFEIIVLLISGRVQSFVKFYQIYGHLFGHLKNNLLLFLDTLISLKPQIIPSCLRLPERKDQ